MSTELNLLSRVVFGLVIASCCCCVVGKLLASSLDAVMNQKQILLLSNIGTKKKCLVILNLS